VFISAGNMSVLILRRTFWYHCKFNSFLLLNLLLLPLLFLLSLPSHVKATEEALVATIFVNWNLISRRGNLNWFICTPVFEVAASGKRCENDVKMTAL
jgi:hypothetical protein